MSGSTILEDARLAARSMLDYAGDIFNPTVRLGVTGLSRSGKTVFITALVNGLLNKANWPVFEPLAKGRISRVTLAEQPDDGVPRFPIEDHLATLTGKNRQWPEGTRRISEIRVIIDYESKGGWFGGQRRSLTLDIVDYPGEWLLDLPLLSQSYAQWSRTALEASRQSPRRELAGEWHALLAETDPKAAADEMTAKKLADSFTAYLRSCRDERVSLSTLPPGRFLMPGDMEGSPALTFCPLETGEDALGSSLAGMMARRFEAYKRLLVQPFYRDHFARLDRQIVLVDALSAINAGPAAFADLETALADVLKSFRPGQNSWLSSILSRRIDRILFAATKADHIHHTSHDRLELILKKLTQRAQDRASFSGAQVDVAALASIRATRETTVKRGRDELSCIVGTPLAGERVGDEVFDGTTEIAVFPGELPDNPVHLFDDDRPQLADDYRFVRFRPPLVKGTDFPHIRLDRAAQFLIGDRLA